MNIANIGELVKYYRTIEGMSQSDLANGICSREYLGNIERGQQLPTIHIINLLSEKLHVNLYKTYDLILHHKDISTHQIIEKFNECYRLEDLSSLAELVSQYENEEAFLSGEPKQFILYSKAIIMSNTYYDYCSAVNYAKQGIIERHPYDFTVLATRALTNIELNLLTCVAVNLCRDNSITEGESVFCFLIEYLSQFLNKMHYQIEANYHYTISILGAITYNHFIFCKKNDYHYIESLEKIISLLVSYKATNFLPDLLLCKSLLLYKFGQKEASLLAYHQGHYLGLLQYGEEIKNIENEILAEYRTILEKDVL